MGQYLKAQTETDLWYVFEMLLKRSAAGRPVFRYSFAKHTVTEPLPKAAERPSVDWSLPMRV